MVRTLIFGAAVLMLSLSVTTAFACQFDTDCDVGSSCLKSSGNIYGYCVGGMNPGNQNDRQPAYNPLDPSRKQGNTCQFQTDCGIGQNCVKSAGQINGVCL